MHNNNLPCPPWGNREIARATLSEGGGLEGVRLDEVRFEDIDMV